MKREKTASFQKRAIFWMVVLATAGVLSPAAAQNPSSDAKAPGQVADGAPASSSEPAPSAAPVVASTARKKVRKKQRAAKAASETATFGHKKKKSGYNYDDSRYLSQSPEKNTYRFDEEGRPIVQRTGKKGKKGGGKTKGSGDSSLGAQTPKPKLKKVSFEGDKSKDAAPNASANPYSQPPAGADSGNVNITP